VERAPAGLIGRLWRSPTLLLSAASLFWAGNFVVARAVHETMPPAGLAFWRWVGSLAVILGFAWPQLRRDAPALWRGRAIVLLLAALGIAAFSGLTYLGLQSTTAINALLLQSATPLVILVCSFVLFGDRVRPLQLLAVAISLAGVVVIIARGAPSALRALSLNAGDGWVFAAVVCYALYSALLRLRPAGHPLSFLAVGFALGAALLLPFYVREQLTGVAMRPSLAGLIAIAYLSVFPSCLAYLFYNRGVELVGANRAGQFFHLMPVFGTLLAIALLGEAVALYQAAGIALIAVGIGLAAAR
jgi:drug/metabolite transporter (DMT)-like permease